MIFLQNVQKNPKKTQKNPKWDFVVGLGFLGSFGVVPCRVVQDVINVIYTELYMMSVMRILLSTNVCSGKVF